MRCILFSLFTVYKHGFCVRVHKIKVNRHLKRSVQTSVSFTHLIIPTSVRDFQSINATLKNG